MGVIIAVNCRFELTRLFTRKMLFETRHKVGSELQRGGDREPGGVQRQHPQVSQEAGRAQREIEKAVRQALAEHTLKGQREVPGRGDSDAWRSRSLARDQRGD
jgi:hypothetical protein